MDDHPNTGNQPTPNPDQPAPTPQNRTLYTVVLPVLIGIGVLFTAGLVVSAATPNGALVFFFILPIMMLIGLIAAPIIIVSSIANSRTHTPPPTTNTDPDALATTTPTSEPSTSTTEPATSSEPSTNKPLARWRTDPRLAIPATIVWYLLLLTIAAISIYAYAWLEETNRRGDHSTITLIPIIALIASSAWAAVLRFPSNTTDRTIAATLCSVLLFPIVLAVIYSPVYDAGRDNAQTHLSTTVPDPGQPDVLEPGDSLFIDPDSGRNYPNSVVYAGSDMYLPNDNTVRVQVTPDANLKFRTWGDTGTSGNNVYLFTSCIPGTLTWTVWRNDRTQPLTGQITVLPNNTNTGPCRLPPISETPATNDPNPVRDR